MLKPLNLNIMKRLIIFCCLLAVFGCSKSNNETPLPKKGTILTTVYSYDQVGLDIIYPIDIQVTKIGGLTEPLNLQYKQISGKGELVVYLTRQSLSTGESITLKTTDDISFDYTPSTTGIHELVFIVTDSYGSIKENRVTFNCSEERPICCVGMKNCVARAKTPQYFFLELNSENPNDEFQVIVDKRSIPLYIENEMKRTQIEPEVRYAFDSGVHKLMFTSAVTSFVKFTVIYPDGTEKQYEYTLDSFNNQIFNNTTTNRSSEKEPERDFAIN